MSLQVNVLLSVYDHFVVLGLVISHKVSAYIVWLLKDEWYRKCNTHKDSMDTTGTLTLKARFQSLHKTLQLMMMYQPIKCGRKMTTCSVDMIETVTCDYVCPHCDHDLDDSKPSFLQETCPWWHITKSHVVMKGSAFEEISSRWTFAEILNHFELFLWPWSWLQQSNPIFSQDSPAYNNVPSKQA